MAVQLPSLQKIQPSAALPANERIDVQARDQSSNILSRTNAIGNLAEGAVDLFDTIEDTQVQNLSLKAEEEFTTWNNDKLAKLKNYEGDPTDGYKEYETEAADKYDEILNARPDLSERVRSRLDANFSKAASGQRMAAMKQRGAQQETYNNNVFEAGIKLKKDNLGVSAGYIQKDDPSSFAPMDDNINEIRNTIIQRGLTKGTVTRLPDDAKTGQIYKDADGKIVRVEMSDIAKQRTAKELSEGIGASLTSMVASGYETEAKQAYERYQAYLDPKTKTSLQNKFKTAGVKSTAFEEVARIEAAGGDQLSKIDAIKDPEVKSEVLKIIDTNQARREHFRKRKEEKNYQVAAKHIQSKMMSGNPYFGDADLENDPVVKATFDNMNANDQKAIRAMVLAPKNTDPKSEIKMQQLIFGELDIELKDMDPLEFAKYTAGLSKADKNKYTNIYNKAKNQTGGEESASLKRAGAMLQDQFLIDGHISRNKYGKIAGDDEITLLAAKTRLIDAMDKQGPMSAKEAKDFVKEFSAAEIVGKTFNPTVKRNVTAPPPTDASATAPANKNEIILTPKRKTELKKQYRDTVTGKFPSDSDPKFITWLKGKS